MVTKIRGVGKDIVIQPRSGIVHGNRGLFAIWTFRFGVNHLFPFPLATALLIGDVMMNRQSGVKMFLSAIIAPIVLAHVSDFLIRRCFVKNCKTPANLIRHARLFKIRIRLRQYIGADVLLPPILLALWMFISRIGKADRMGNCVT
jgi:hypothetical protein